MNSSPPLSEPSSSTFEQNDQLSFFAETETIWVIADLGETCNFLKSDYVSLRCGVSATSAVIDPSTGELHMRCEWHEGKIDEFDIAPVVRAITNFEQSSIFSHL